MENEKLPSYLVQNDYEDKTEEQKQTEHEEKREENDEYYSLPVGTSRSIVFSVASLVLAIISVFLCFLHYVGFASAVCALVFALIFRRQFGYFNKPAVLGLIISVFGIVFSVFSLVVEILGIF